MPRIQAHASSSDSEVAGLIEQIKAERGGRLLLLYQVLLNSAPVARGWLKLLTAIRQQTSISGALRELIILRVAVLNGAPYEFENHAPIARQEGVPEAWIEAIRHDASLESLPALEQAVLRYTDEMTRQVKVTPETYAAVARHFSDKKILELTTTVAAYNMVSRVLVALEIDTEHH